ncbi:MAG: PepSY domain-containing protein [Lentilitoribacter sp.]
MIKKLIIGNVAAGLILTGGLVGVAVADTKDKQAITEAPTVSMIQAIEIANTQVPGIVLEAELENEDGTTIYEIEIVKADGIEMEIEINAESGEVLTVEENDGGKKGKKNRKS